MGKTPLLHNDSNMSVLSYGNEDLAQYRDLPQATTRMALSCVGAVSSNPLLGSHTHGFREHKFMMRISQFSQRVGHKLVVKSTKACIDVGLTNPTKWCLLIYPNGNQEDRQGFVSLYLYRWDKQPTPVPATFTFSLINSHKEKAFIVDVNEKKMFGHAPGNSKSLGAPKFVSRDDLFDSSWGLLDEDTLTVVCELNVFTGESLCNKGVDLSQLMRKGIKFCNMVEELHYQQHPDELNKKRQGGDGGTKGGNINVGLFNPMRFLHSIDTWKKVETEI